MRLSLHYALEQIWNLFFPPSHEERIVASLNATDVHALFSLGYTAGVWSLSSFKHPTVRVLIHEAKFHRNTRAHVLLAELLKLFLQEKKSLTSSVWLSIPLSEKRVRSRGYNQVLEILRAGQLPLHIETKCLKRTKDTAPQTELPRSARFHNMEGAFTVMRPECIMGKDVVIFDDVTTTGATLHAAQSAISPFKPASITLVALAH